MSENKETECNGLAFFFGGCNHDKSILHFRGAKIQLFFYLYL
jgi:hypothetical protein